MIFSAYKNPYYNPNKQHHRPNGFDNLEPTPLLQGSELWRWYRNNRKKGLPRPPHGGYPTFQKLWVTQPDFNLTGDRVWWLFHSTLLFKFGDQFFLTDPIFSQRCSPLQFLGPKRKTNPLFTLEDLPKITAILISHNHYDHLDRNTIRWFIRHHPEISFIVPLGLKRWFTRLGAKMVTELDWWDQQPFTLNQDPLTKVTITALPAHHWSKRTLWDSKRTLWCGYMLTYQGGNHYFAGDTAYFKSITQIGDAFPINTAFIPIGAYLPRQFMKNQHSSPKEGMRILREVGAEKMVPIHWGTFELANDGLDGALRGLDSWLERTPEFGQRVSILKMGEALPL